MPLLFLKELNEHTKLGVWKITESEQFFSQSVRLQKEIRHPHKRLQHLAGRFLLKQLFPDFPVSDIYLSPSNKPLLPSQAYHFSISHCREFAAAIVSTYERVGIDIEYPTRKLLDLKHKFLNKGEADFILDESIEKITVFWSVKEAMFKWWGLGKVDFRKNLLVNDFPATEKGSGTAVFRKERFEQLLHFHYEFVESLCTVWICSDWKNEQAESEIAINSVRPDQILELQDISRRTFLETFSVQNSSENMEKYLSENLSLRKLGEELSENDSRFFFATVGGKVAAYLKINFRQAQTELKEENALEIERIYVLKTYQRRKLGQLLLNKAIEIAAQEALTYIWLGVWEENKRAIDFYTANGFKPFDKHVFKLGEDEQTDIMMKLQLKREGG